MDRAEGGGLGGLPTPLVVLCAGIVAGGLWPFCILLFMICPNCAGTQLFLVPYSFFVFCCLKRADVCPGASTAAKGPTSHIPACLITCLLPSLTFGDSVTPCGGGRLLPTQLSWEEEGLGVPGRAAGLSRGFGNVGM